MLPTIGRFDTLRGQLQWGETFTYTVRDNSGAEAVATVTVQVQPVNDPPVANADSYTFIEGSTDNFLDVLSNDNDGVDENESLSISNVGRLARVERRESMVAATQSCTRHEPDSPVPKRSLTRFAITTANLDDYRDHYGQSTCSLPPTAVNDLYTVSEDALAAILMFWQTTDQAIWGNIDGRECSGNQGGIVSTSSSHGTRLRYTPKQTSQERNW